MRIMIILTKLIGNAVIWGKTTYYSSITHVTLIVHAWHLLTTDGNTMARSLLLHQTPVVALQDRHADPADMGCQSPGTFSLQAPSCEVNLSKVFKGSRRKRPFIHQEFRLVKKCLRKRKDTELHFSKRWARPFCSH